LQRQFFWNKISLKKYNLQTLFKFNSISYNTCIEIIIQIYYRFAPYSSVLFADALILYNDCRAAPATMLKTQFKSYGSPLFNYVDYFLRVNAKIFRYFYFGDEKKNFNDYSQHNASYNFKYLGLSSAGEFCHWRLNSVQYGNSRSKFIFQCCFFLCVITICNIILSSYYSNVGLRPDYVVLQTR